MNRHAELADFFMAGCTIRPLPLLFNFGPIAALAVMVPLPLLGCYHGALERTETGEGPLFGDGLDGSEPPPDARRSGPRR